MTAHTIAAWTMLVLTGIWTGVILTFAVERVNLWARMPVEQFAIDFRRSLFRVDPMQPIIGGMAMIAILVFVFTTDHAPARIAAWVALGLIVIVFVSTVAIAEPMNSKFRRLPEGSLPENADGLRRAWRRFHSVRTILAIAAFCTLSIAVLT